MGTIKKNKTIPLSWFFLKYFMFLCFGVLVSVVAAIALFNALFANHVLYPANAAELQASQAYDKISRAEKVSADLIPELCNYVVFDKQGAVTEGNLSEQSAKAAWKAVEGNLSDQSSGFFKVIPRKEGYCVLQYQIIPQYRNPFLREHLPSFQTLLFLIAGVILCGFVVLVAVRFGRALTKKMNPLILAAEKIQKQELDFSIRTSSIREIDVVLRSMDQMRSALRESLESQWKAEQLRKEQISALAHDLKTPMTVIRGNTELVCETALSKEQRECMEYIEDSTLQMQDYVKRLIGISKAEDSGSAEFQRVEMNQLMADLKGKAEGMAAVKQIDLLWKLEGLPETMELDRELFSRAVINILANAVEFTPPKGTVQVSVLKTEERVEFQISDSGPGFTPRAISQGKLQFYMGDESRGAESHYGMGLYIADTICRQHKGELILGNSPSTGGAEVRIVLNLE